MRWPSPWSDGFPGWHIECSAMSKKYLGPHFDIHGGGMDLLFPHHECEIAQSVAGNGQEPVKYWIHNNMLTINGQKMGKSLGNFITIEQLITGTHPLLEQPYSAMTVRFFILQAQYRSTLDFSNAALQAAEKGFSRLMQAFVQLSRLKAGDKSTLNVQQWVGDCYAAMNDDFNSAILIAKLFEAAGWINQVSAGQASLSEEDLALFKEQYTVFITDILGLIPEENDGSEKIEGLMELIIDLRKNARTQKDFATSDKIRDQLSALGFVIKDSKEGSHWEYN
jgi:cysteinyl-tRNA synthetase